MSNVESSSRQAKAGRIPLSRVVVWNTVRMRVVPPLVLLVALAFVVWQWINMNPGGFPGLTEGARSGVAAPLDAYVAELKVRPYQEVKAGDVLAVLKPSDVRTRLDLLQSELQIARMTLEPTLGDRNAVNFERLRIDQLRLQEELAVSEIELQRAESALKRSTQLLTEKLISLDAHEIALRNRDAFGAEVMQRKAALAQINERLSALQTIGEPDPKATNAIIAKMEGMLRDARSELGNVTVVAPISGMVHGISRAKGDFVGKGEPLLTVYSQRSDRVIVYLRQPYQTEPQIGLKVKVMTKSYERQQFITEISEVGAQLESITNSLAIIKPGALVDVGLPIVINVPEGVSIRPGETVDVTFLSRRERGGNMTAAHHESGRGL